MRISITTDDGEVIEIIESRDIGDLSKPLAKAAIIETIIRAQKIDGEKNKPASRKRRPYRTEFPTDNVYSR